MAKSKIDKISSDDEMSIFTELAKEFDGDVLSQLGDVSYFIDTGSLAVNYILSGKFLHGGIPGKRITEVYGPSASGKTFLASNVIYGAQKIGGVPVLLDCENANNSEFMQKTSHVNPKHVLRFTPQSLEQAFSKILNVSKKIREKKNYDVPIVFVYDSISVSPCERELKETLLPENYTAAMWKKLVGRNEQPGERAKVCGKELRKLQAKLEELNITLLVINQTRDKIGVLYGCHFGESMVYLADGSAMRIDEIVRDKKSVEVLSYNPITHVIESKKVIGWHDNGLLGEDESFLEIKFQRHHCNEVGYLRCTPNHIIFVERDGLIKEIPASEITVGDQVIQIQPHYPSQNNKTPQSVKYRQVSGEVISIEPFQHDNKQKFDLTIEDNATYVIDGAIVHNSPETTAGGGKALPFYASCRFRTSTKKKINNQRLGTFAGVNMKVANIKNRSCRPFIESEGIKLYFDSGINPISGLLTLFIQDERIVTAGKGLWSVTDKYLPEGKSEYKFRASKESNDVPLQVIYDCPALVDAKNHEELNSYLTPFSEALKNSDSGDFIEKTIAFDEEGNPLDEDMDLVSELEEMENAEE